MRAGVRGVLPFAVLVLAWAALARSGWLPPVFLPPPAEVARTAGEMLADGSLWAHVGASLGRVAVEPVLEPIAGFFNSLSGIAWLPLAITWFGLGWLSVTFILFNTIFFLVFFNTLVGVRTVPRILEQAVRTLGGRRRHLILQVLIPGALPSIVTGIRLGVGFGWRALIAAEMIATTTGLGYLIYDAANFHRTDTILVGIIAIGTLWLATDRLLLIPVERWTVERWGLVSRTGV